MSIRYIHVYSIEPNKYTNVLNIGAHMAQMHNTTLSTSECNEYGNILCKTATQK